MVFFVLACQSSYRVGKPNSNFVGGGALPMDFPIFGGGGGAKLPPNFQLLGA